MRVIEALRDIDGGLVEWLMKEGLTPEQRDALVEARSDLIGNPNAGRKGARSRRG